MIYIGLVDIMTDFIQLIACYLLNTNDTMLAYKWILERKETLSDLFKPTVNALNGPFPKPVHDMSRDMIVCQ